MTYEDRPVPARPLVGRPVERDSCAYESWRLTAGSSSIVCAGGGDVFHHPAS